MSGGFLDDMARSSAARAAEAMRHESLQALERRALAAGPCAPLRMSGTGFDVIAELKLRSPAAGMLSDASQDWLGRVAAYAHGGAWIVHGRMGLNRPYRANPELRETDAGWIRQEVLDQIATNVPII